MTSWSRYRLGYLKSCGLVISISQILYFPGQDPSWDASNFVASWSRPVKTPVGIRQVFWLRSQDAGWDTSSFAASWSRSRLKYFKLCGFVAKMPNRIIHVL